MRRNNILSIVVFSTVLLLSCKTDNDKRKTSDSATPAALQDPKILRSESYNSGDLVQGLYKESAEMSPELKELESDILGFNTNSDKALSVFRSYDAKSESYYSMADSYLIQIKDSILRARIDTILHQSKKEYEATKKDWTQLVAQANKQNQVLHDQHTILKLLVTLPLIEKFQKDILPDSADFAKQLAVQEGLIKRIERAQGSHGK